MVRPVTPFFSSPPSENLSSLTQLRPNAVDLVLNGWILIDACSEPNRCTDTGRPHLMNTFVTTLDCRHDLIPLSFNIGSIRMELRVQIGFTKYILAGDDIL